MSRFSSFALVLLTSALTSLAIVASLWAVGLVRAGPGLMPSLQGGAPTVINYQGRLTDPSTGQAKADGSYDMVFRLYDAETGGSPLWTGTYTAANGNPVTVRGGLFSVLLGSGGGNSLSAGLFSGTDRWIAVQVGSETLSPRQRMGSVPYALQAEEAKNAATLSGQGPSAFVGQGQANSITSTMLITGAVTSNALAAGAVVTSAITDGAVSSSKLATGAVLSTTLADSSVTSAKIADSAVTSGKLASGAVTSTALADSVITNTHISARAAISPTKLAFYGDGGGGSGNFTSTTTLSGNSNFTDCNISPGVTLTVRAGTIIRCTGSFTNSGTILVSEGAATGRIDLGYNVDQLLPKMIVPGAGDAGGPAGLPEVGYGNITVEGGEGGDGLPTDFEIWAWHQLGRGGGGGTSRFGGVDSASGGGLLRVMARGSIVNAGTIQANGRSMSADGGGGGGGGMVVLASSTAVTNTGTIEAKGGNGGLSNTIAGPGGGGGGGLIMFMAPIVSDTGSTTVSGGVAGSAGTSGSVTDSPRRGGGGGGGSVGAGGRGGQVSGTGGSGDPGAAVAGSAGRVATLQADPVTMWP